DSPMPLDGVVLARVNAHINQRKAGTMAAGLDRNDVLVSVGSHLQLHSVSAGVIVTRHGFGQFILVVVVCVACVPAAVALDGLAILRQLFVVIGDDFVGSVI